MGQSHDDNKSLAYKIRVGEHAMPGLTSTPVVPSDVQISRLRLALQLC